jgi:hypothetical protein
LKLVHDDYEAEVIAVLAEEKLQWPTAKQCSSIIEGLKVLESEGSLSALLKWFEQPLFAPESGIYYLLPTLSQLSH